MFTRTILAIFSMLVMLAGYVPLPALATQPAASGCCLDGHACCRKAHRHSTGPQWQADSCCSPACCGLAGTLSNPRAELLTATAYRYVAKYTWTVAPAPRTRASSAQYPLYRLQRPPPHFA